MALGRFTPRGTPPDAKPESDPAVRIVCDAPSHSEIVIATYRYTGSVSPGRAGARNWYYDGSLAVGGGPVDPEVRKREWRHKRPPTPEEVEQGWRPDAQVDREPKRQVEGSHSSDELACPKCGLRLLVNRDKLQHRLDLCVEHGVSRLGLPALVAIVTKH
jgi:hypothetical protein